MQDAYRPQAWIRSFQDLLEALPGLVSDRLELLALELHRASRSMVKIIVLGLAAAMMAMTAWLTLSVALALGLMALGLTWPLALLGVLLVNLALAWVAVSRVRGLLSDLGLPATRRHLGFGAPAGSAQALPVSRDAVGSQLEARP